MICCSGLTKTYGAFTVLRDASFSLSKRERVGLVGANGVGKSTLLRILAGIEAPDSGKVELLPGSRVGYFPQEIPLEEKESTVRELLFSGEGETGGRPLKLMEELRFSQDLLDRRVDQLSGGERSKLNLIRILGATHDIVLLDEPTNNLDLVGLEHLEKFIKTAKAAFLIVSHDRMLLDRTVDRVLEIDPYTHALASYRGGFTDYMRQRRERILREWERYSSYESEVDRLKASASKQEQWSSQGQSGPRSTDNDKYLRGYSKDRSGKKLGSSAAALEQRLKRIDEVQKPVERQPLSFSFNFTERSGTKVFELRDAVLYLPGRQVGPIDLAISWGERIAIVGANGVGKTTLVRAMLGEIALDQGSSKIGTRMRVGYLPQLQSYAPKSTALDVMRSETRGVQESLMRQLLDRFGLDKRDVEKRVVDLSPGERSRLTLAILVGMEPNCIVLDEPSNHLDLEALEALEAALEEFKGTVVTVTHDRYFLGKLRPSSTYVLKQDGTLGQVRDYQSHGEETL